MKTAKKYWNKWKHGSWICLYLIFYLLGFFILEHAGHRHYHLIHTVFDDMIPHGEKRLPSLIFCAGAGIPGANCSC